MDDRYEWDLRLQDMLEQTVKDAYQGTWEYSYQSNQGMACDIPDIEGKFEVKRFEHVVEAEDLAEIKARFRWSQANLEEWKNNSTVQGCLFQCLVCGEHRLYVDVD